MKILTYIGVAPLNRHVNEILSEILRRIEDSGLREESDNIKICVNDSGDFNLLDQDLFRNERYELVRNNHPHEFGALELLWRDSFVHDAHLCYVHTKGITMVGDDRVSDWRRYMSHFVLNEWQERVKDLEDYHCSGVNLQGSPVNILRNPLQWKIQSPLHYSGNFWWSRSDHVRKLPSPLFWTPTTERDKWRIMNEMWLCQSPHSRYKCAWSSGVNHYHQRYEEKNYIKVTR